MQQVADLYRLQGSELGIIWHSLIHWFRRHITTMTWTRPLTGTAVLVKVHLNSKVLTFVAIAYGTTLEY